MSEKRFKVYWGDEMLAQYMKLTDALIFIRALCETYFNECIDIRLASEEIGIKQCESEVE